MCVSRECSSQFLPGGFFTITRNLLNSLKNHTTEMKRKVTRIFIIVIIVAVVGGAGIFAYLIYQETSNRNPYTTMSEDAVFVMRTDNLSRGWKKLTNTKFWNTLKKTEKYESITRTANKLDSIITKNKTVSRMLQNRPVMLSAHMTETYNYEIKFTVDLLKASKVIALKDFALQIIRLYGYDYVKMNYKEQEIIEIVDKENSGSFYLSFIDNIMVISFSQKVIKETIDLEEDKSLAENEGFRTAKNKVSSVDLLLFYFNYDKLEDFIRVYQNPANYRSMINTSRAASFMALELGAESNRLILEGQTSYHDSIVSPYIKTLRNIKPSKPRAFPVVPQQAAVYLSFTFQDFPRFHSMLLDNYKKIDSASYHSFQERMKQINKILDLNVKNQLTSWISNEIAILKLQPDHKTGFKDAVACIQTDDMEEAQESLETLNKHIKKNLPAKFESRDYLGYPIYYLNISGFFKFLFSDLLSRIEKPYYTYMGEYVIFSNKIENIYKMIEARVKEQTVAINDEYMNFVSDISSKSPVNIYINTPPALKFLLSHANPRTKTQIKNNKEVLASFSRIGIQVIPKSRTIETNMLIDHDKNALYKTSLTELESQATELYSLKLREKDYFPDIPKEYQEHSTFITLYYKDSVKVKAEGKLKQGKPDGKWRLFYPSGNIKAVVNYNEGEIENKAFFYYDHPEQPLRCEAVFDDNELEGPYKEFYKNGNMKAELTFDNNQANGKANFYYTNEILKVEGKYKNGSKKGNWTYYAPDGKEYDKKYWRKHKD